MGTEREVLKIIQISDCHLQADEHALYRGENADANLQSVWRRALDWQPGLILLTGDLCETPSETAYARLSALLQTDLPLLALPGNHDDAGLMQRWFPDGAWDGVKAVTFGAWLVLLLDSTIPGLVGGGIPEQRLARLKEALSDGEAEHVLIALHHQPVPVGAPWIDRYPLHEPEDFLEAVDAEPRIRCVIWGHIHHAFSAWRAGKWLLGAPSSAVNSLPETQRFEADPAGPACRWLKLFENGEVDAGILHGRAEQAV